MRGSVRGSVRGSGRGEVSTGRGASVRAVARRGEAGSGTVLVLCVACVLWCAGVGAAWVGAAVVARHRASAAADMAALAAADRARAGTGAACAAATRVARGMHGRVLRCSVRRRVADVTVAVSLPWADDSPPAVASGLPHMVSERARAGPASALRPSAAAHGREYGESP